MKYKAKTKEELKNILNEMQYNVTQNNGTEPPFRNEYYDNFGNYSELQENLYL